MINSICMLGIGMVVTFAYWPGLYGGFLFDDAPNITDNPLLSLFDGSLSSLVLTVGNAISSPMGRPLSMASFALNRYWGGLDPFAFKLTNLGIHLVNGWLVFLLGRRLFRMAQPTSSLRHQLIASWMLAAAWLLHPIQLLPVLHVVQRMTSLSALFLLLALLCHMHGRDKNPVQQTVWLLVGWCIFWPLSIFSKETGFLFPLFALAWELIARRVAVGRLDLFSRGFAIAVLGMAVLAAVYMIFPSGDWLWAGYSLRSFSLVERLLTEGRVLWFYIGLIFFPRLEAFGLFHDDFAVSTGIFAPWTTLPSLAGLMALAWLAWRTRVSNSLVSFGIVWFLVGHGMESTVLPLEIVHEHRNYLPLIGLLLVFVSVLLRGFAAVGPLNTLSVALMLVMLSYFSFVTALRAHEFGDEMRRTQIEAQHHRGSARAQYEAGRVLGGLAGANSPNSPAYSFAKTHYEMAGQLDPDFKMNWLGLIHLNCQAGVPVDRLWVDELNRRLRDTPFAPGDRTVLYSLKEMSIARTVCLERSDVDALFAAVIANSGVSPGVQAMIHSWHADYLWLREHDLLASRIALGRSLALVPWNSSNRLKWAQLHYLSGEYEQARKLLLELRGERFSVDERKTLDELLSDSSMLGGLRNPKPVEQ